MKFTQALKNQHPEPQSPEDLQTPARRFIPSLRPKRSWKMSAAPATL